MKSFNTHTDAALRAAIERTAASSEKSELSSDFVERLMQRIEADEKPSRRQPQKPWLRIVNAASTVAAVLLVAFFVTLRLPSPAETMHVRIYTDTNHLPASCTLAKAYQSRRPQTDTSQLTYTNFKRMTYEHQ